MSEKLNSELFALIPKGDCSKASQDTSDLAGGEAWGDSRSKASVPVLYAISVNPGLEMGDKEIITL
jgi:hypothetical protein